MWKYQSFLKGSIIEHRFQYTSCTAGGCNDVYLVATDLSTEIYITAISNNLVTTKVYDKNGKVSDIALLKIFAPAFGKKFDLLLQIFIYG